MQMKMTQMMYLYIYIVFVFRSAGGCKMVMNIVATKRATPKRSKSKSRIVNMIWLVVSLEHFILYMFPFIWEFHHPNRLSYFFRGVGTTTNQIQLGVFSLPG